MTLAQIISQKTAGGTGSLFTGLKNFFSTDAGDISVSNSERWVFMGCRFIFHITAAICTFYAPMKILPEPFQEVFPEWGNTIAVALSCVFVFAVEFFTYSIARRATINSLKLAKEEFDWSVLGNTVFWAILSIAIGYFSWACAQSGADNIAAKKFDKTEVITSGRDVKVDILKSKYKELIATTTAAHNKSIKAAEDVLTGYQTRKGAETWIDPKMVERYTKNIESARNAKDKELNKIESSYKEDLATEDGKAKPLLEKNAAKQSMYQKYIPFVSLMIEFGKFIFIFLLVQLEYKGGGQKPQQHRQEQFDMSDMPPISLSQKKTLQQIPVPIVMEEEEVVQEVQYPINSHAAPSENSTDWVKVYTRLMNNRRVYTSKIKNTEKQGEFESTTKSWLKNEPLIMEACKHLNRPYDNPKQPTNDRFKQTEP